jgi:ferredoxin--NADP+ reductase
MCDKDEGLRVAIVGAGPAGIFAARELAANGVNVALFNRDIKPGGLAEYGIYPEKYRIKDGLRGQFHEILACPNIHYYGNTSIGENYPLHISNLKEMGFEAVLVAAGAQGTKWLGVPGEECKGVYHAKELVCHYNHLPPYAAQSFAIGKKVAVVGVGNVMTDIVRYLCTLPQVEEITTIARRGLAEIKFDRRELDPIVGHLDWPDFQAEVERIQPVMTSIGQESKPNAELISESFQAAPEKSNLPVWRLRFLYSPAKILCPAEGRVWCLRLEENSLVDTPEGTKARGTGKFSELEVETVIFAIGDSVDPGVGLPLRGSGYAISAAPRYPESNISFELDQQAGAKIDLDGVFVCGWSRNASTGMVGIARRDGMNASRAVLAYLQAHSPGKGVSAADIEAKLAETGYTFVTTAALSRLEAAEKDRAQQLNQVEFKFDTNEEMLRVME